MTDACGTLRGSLGGVTRHYLASEPSCADCKAAKAAYDADRIKRPDVRLQHLLTSKAARRAKARYARYPDAPADVYRLLYQEEKARAFAEAGVEL